MDKRKITKTIVSKSNSMVLGAVTSSIIRDNTRTFTNPYANLLMKVATGVACWSVGDVVMAPVKVHTDAKIDEIFDAFAPKKTEEVTE